ncbi:hypothetical protein [Micromonospora narathiwatensis]|uniref:Uncharacterized protein n=1 Tax=Micromonospora narathiwatensis TaxID=299146 RepID=A0A1A8ZAW8_9ACTN|nr:hypothetical protein [Micromonospora narathiwatensis]SBT41016.1 hypothetical protein GA0070621_1118 [Micromonospora narathiwatensis]
MSITVDDDLLNRAGELKRQLVSFSQQPRYDRAFDDVLASRYDGRVALDEHTMMILWDYFVLEHRLRNGRTVVEQFVAAHPELPEPERQMLLGWRDVVQGPFEVQGRDGAALVVVNLVDELTYCVRSNMGPSVFRRTPRRSFLLARLVAVGEEWMISGPMNVWRAQERDVAYEMALEMSLRAPEAVYRNPEKLAQAWELQRQDRDRFVRFFGSDLVVVAGDQVADRMADYHAFCRAEVPGTPSSISAVDGPVLELPPDVVDAETVAMIYDEVDGLGFYAEFGLVEAAFADPDLLRRRRYREHTMAYLQDDSVAPLVLRRLAELDPERASVVFRRLLKKPRFDWARDGEELLRAYKPEHFRRAPRPRVSPVSERLAAYARRR